MKRIPLFLIAILLCAAPAPAAPNPVIVIVLDGLRPDYVRPDLMPNVHALGQKGVVCAKHHSIFPTVTRVNSTSFSTGCYPARHGIIGNSMYVPAVDKEKPFSTGSAEHLRKLDAATNGGLVGVPTLGELLDGAGLRLFVASSGSSGSAFLLNPRVNGGGIVNSEMVLPESAREHAETILGPPPGEAIPQVTGNRRAVDAVLKIGMDKVSANLVLLWITDPDHTAHPKGIGSPETVAALNHVDEEVGRLLLEMKKQLGGHDPNVIITSDHGFSTQTSPGTLVQLLVQAGIKKSLASTDVIVSDGAIYLDRDDEASVAAVVQTLQQTPWIGPIFTPAQEAGGMIGSVPGTFSFDAVRWNHARAGDILVDVTWSDDANAYGWKGSTSLNGVAGHGSSSPYDIHNTLIAAGPDFKSGVVSSVPTGNVDIAPTVCKLLGISPAPPMDGRVLDEILAGGPSPDTITVETQEVKTERRLDTLVYRCELHFSTAADRRYFDFARTEREAIVP